MDDSVRPATAGDAEAIRTVHRRSIRELGEDGYDDEQVQAWASAVDTTDYTDLVESDDVAAVVAERDGEVVGFGTLVHEEPDEFEADVDAEITAVYVDPMVTRRGFGRAIFRELEQRARKAGHETMGLWSSRNAVPFYEEVGFEHVAEQEHTFSEEQEGDQSTSESGSPERNEESEGEEANDEASDEQGGDDEVSDEQAADDQGVTGTVFEMRKTLEPE